MRWPWQRRAPRPTIPPYQVPVSKRETPEARGIVVEEHDSTDVDMAELQSRTGMQRVFDRITGKFKE